MPIYEYRCEACNEVHEALQKASDAPLTDCSACGEPRLRKLIGRVGVLFKGSGFHVNDYSRGGGRKSGSPKTESANSTPAPSETKSDPKVA